MNRAWLWIMCGGLFETVWAVFMKFSEGFTVPVYTLLTIIFLIVSTLFLNKGLKLGLPCGPAYAVWVGIGAIGAVFSGMLVFGEMITPVGCIFLMMVIAGIIGMNLATKDE